MIRLKTLALGAALLVGAALPSEAIGQEVLTPNGGEIKFLNGGSGGGVDAPSSKSKKRAQRGVEVKTFEGEIEDGAAVLQWKTRSEVDEAMFVERKVNDRAEGSWKELSSLTNEETTWTFEDTEIPFEADTLTYRLGVEGKSGETIIEKRVSIARRAPTEVRLLGTYPNPARTRVTVKYAIPEEASSASVRMELYDVLGRRVRNARVEKGPGRYRQTFEVESLSSGTYFLRVRTNRGMKTRKLTVLK